jgi:hypothetical protein
MAGLSADVWKTTIWFVPAVSLTVKLFSIAELLKTST